MEMKLDNHYWNERYKEDQTGWDLGLASPPLIDYFSSISDKNISMLIPGCGNAYEAEWLLEHGFTDITLIDISPILIEKLSRKFKMHINSGITLIRDDFFNCEGQYDLIVEQTFFCALNPSLRTKYAEKMHALLKKDGKLVGLLFDRDFISSPPFGGHADEYKKGFSPYFNIEIMDPCQNSVTPRMGTELFFMMTKK
jgi:SAM-dependent methyltransferase